MQVVIWLLTCSVFVHVYAFRFFSLLFHCVSVFVCVCVCPFYSMDLCGLIQIKKERKKESNLWSESCQIWSSTQVVRRIKESWKSVKGFPLRANLYQKWKFSPCTLVGGLVPIPCSDWCEILAGRADLLSPRPRQISRESVQRVAPTGRKCWFSASE